MSQVLFYFRFQLRCLTIFSIWFPLFFANDIIDFYSLAGDACEHKSVCICVGMGGWITCNSVYNFFFYIFIFFSRVCFLFVLLLAATRSVRCVKSVKETTACICRIASERKRKSQHNARTKHDSRKLSCPTVTRMCMSVSVSVCAGIL